MVMVCQYLIGYDIATLCLNIWILFISMQIMMIIIITGWWRWRWHSWWSYYWTWRYFCFSTTFTNAAASTSVSRFAWADRSFCCFVTFCWLFQFVVVIVVFFFIFSIEIFSKFAISFFLPFHSIRIAVDAVCWISCCCSWSVLVVSARTLALLAKHY